MAIRGKLDGWRYTSGGYQITKIDGIPYSTLFDLGDFSGKLKPGVTVDFEIPNQTGHDWYRYPYARILRVVNGK